MRQLATTVYTPKEPSTARTIARLRARITQLAWVSSGVNPMGGLRISTAATSFLTSRLPTVREALDSALTSGALQVSESWAHDLSL